MYYVVFCFFFLFSLLPLRLLYLISDGLYVFLYYVINYRKKVIFSNLLQAFPETTPEERKKIAKKFYKNLSDQMVETIKMISISKKQIRKRFICRTSVFQELKEKNRPYQIHLGHVFNWEWANFYICMMVPPPFLVIYKPLSNRAMDRLFKYMRSRFGSALVASTNLLEEMKPFKGENYTSVLVADQHPPNARRVYWFPFMNKMTSFFKGPELSAKKGDMDVVFGHIQKVKRGHYKIEAKLAFEHARETENAEITGAFVQFLEERIRQQPENWLWSHKRWKRSWKGETN